ncbi:hypothetical protein Peur_005159 [Populus x canadensis]
MTITWRGGGSYFEWWMAAEDSNEERFAALAVACSRCSAGKVAAIGYYLLEFTVPLLSGAAAEDVALGGGLQRIR